MWESPMMLTAHADLRCRSALSASPYQFQLPISDPPCPAELTLALLRPCFADRRLLEFRILVFLVGGSSDWIPERGSSR